MSSIRQTTSLKQDPLRRSVLVNDAFGATTDRTRPELIGKNPIPTYLRWLEPEGNRIEDDAQRVTKDSHSSEEINVDTQVRKHWHLDTASLIAFANGTEYVLGIRTK